MDFGGEFNLNQVPMIGMLANDPSIDAKRNGMHDLANAYQRYRPEVAQARMKALNAQLSAWAPVNGVLGQMYGPSAQFDSTAALQNPLTERMMEWGGNKDYFADKAAAEEIAKTNAAAVAGDKKDAAEHAKNSAPGRNPNKTNATAAGRTPGGSPVLNNKVSYSPGSMG